MYIIPELSILDAGEIKVVLPHLFILFIFMLCNLFIVGPLAGVEFAMDDVSSCPG